MSAGSASTPGSTRPRPTSTPSTCGASSPPPRRGSRTAATRSTPDNFGADPVGPYRGHRFLLDQVRHELAHRQRDELLLWDEWGAIDEDLADWVAERLVAADAGSQEAEEELAERYAADPALHPGGQVHCVSPSGLDAWVAV